jgi:hypothetical protein
MGQFITLNGDNPATGFLLFDLVPAIVARQGRDRVIGLDRAQRDRARSPATRPRPS